MKKLLLTTFCVAALTTISSAQEFGFGKGDVLLEGGIRTFSRKDKQTELNKSEISLNPKVGYFVTDKLAFGVKLNHALSKQDQEMSNTRSTSKASYFGGGVFGRYYFLELGSRFKTFTEVEAGYGKSKFEHFGSNSYGFNLEEKHWSANGSIGANFFITKNIALGYTFSSLISFISSKGKDKSRTNTFSSNINSFDNFFNSGTFSLAFKF